MQIRDFLQRFAVELALLLLAVYFVLRTLGLSEALVAAWTATGVLLALASPVAGLSLLAALGPFTEAQTAAGAITPVPFLLAAVGASIAVRVALARRLSRPPLALVLGLLLLVGTAIGVAHTFLVFGADRGQEAFYAWAPGIGGGLSVMFAAAWIAWHGDKRPIYIAAASIGFAAVIALVDHLTRGAILDSALGWLLRDRNPVRLTGLIPAPNAAAAIFLVGAALGLAAAFFARPPLARVAGGFLAIVAILALGLTYSRSGWLALAVVLAVLAYRWRHRLGLALLAAVLVVVVVTVGAGLVRDVSAAADQARIDAWLASVRMWLADPLLGHGFRSFEWLHSNFGSPTLNAPHNEWLRLFAEGGTIVGLVGLAFAIVVPLTILRGHGWLSAAAAAGAAGFVLMAAFNNPFTYIQVTVPAFMLMGVGLGLAAKRRQPSDSVTRAGEPARMAPSGPP